ncbi:MAG: tRNA pseudouridine(13) synthase TruD [Planctomycetota bacterium]|nr:tRNA pseudouridine(13) synthase TruD [Planctomycetota bacterium]
MKLKVRPTDFKVTERLLPEVLESTGPHRLYRVRKEKLTSMEAATELANLVGVTPGDICMAGLKDRQGVTTQYMSLERGPSVSVQQRTLGIQTVGWTAAPLDSKASLGNEFGIVVRDLDGADCDRVRASLDPVREHGLPNYFDEQRFGNLRHGQGWIVLDLIQGDVSGALQRLIASSSPYEPPARRSLKEALWRSWGNWSACRSIAGKLGRYHSVFEHLKRYNDDFAGAFGRVGTRERLIHLYAFQSHLWNRALELWIDENCPERFGLSGIEGRLRFPKGAMPLPEQWHESLVLPGERLDGVVDPEQRALFERVLEGMGLRPDDLQLPDVPGFQLKPEARPAIVRPLDLRVRPAEQDNEFRGRKMLRLSFGLPRGAYATMVLRRLVGPESRGSEPHDARDGGGPRRGSRRGGRGRGFTPRDEREEYGGDRRGGSGRGARRGARRGSRRGAGRGFSRDDRGGGQGEGYGGGEGRGGFGGDRYGNGGGSRRGGGRGGRRGGGFVRQGDRDDSGGGSWSRDGGGGSGGGYGGEDQGGGSRRGSGRRRGGGSRRGARGGGGRGGPRRGGGARRR